MHNADSRRWKPGTADTWVVARSIWSPAIKGPYLCYREHSHQVMSKGRAAPEGKERQLQVATHHLPSWGCWTLLTLHVNWMHCICQYSGSSNGRYCMCCPATYAKSSAMGITSHTKSQALLLTTMKALSKFALVDITWMEPCGGEE